MTLVDPSPAVARQAGRVLDDRQMRHHGGEIGAVVYYTSGDVMTFRRTLGALLGAEIAVSADVRAARWDSKLSLHEKAGKENRKNENSSNFD